MSLPDLSRVDKSVQTQARERYASLTARIKDSANHADVATAYGEFGMVLHAAEYYDAAEPCYVNAQTLAPTEMRWPYYLGHLYKSRGQTDKAEAAFKRALELRPDDVATLVWLGRLSFDQGRTDEAGPLFGRALALAPRSVAVLAGLGRVALAKRDYAGAAKHLELALDIDPEAESLHAPLAMAYRGLGDLDKAAPHLRQWRNRDLPVPDPLQQELDLLLQSGLSYELRGVRALENRSWPEAAALFRKGLELTHENTPLSRSLRHKLGTALYLTGDVSGAQQQFEEVARLAPASGLDESAAKAHYSLGVMASSKGRVPEAIDHFSSAVKYQPNYVEAFVGLGNASRQDGRFESSLAQYEEAVKINPRAVQARLGYAMALVGLRRYQKARDWLADATKRYPDQPALAHAMARLLATAPDDRVRDGPRAMALVQELFKSDKTTELGETMAMTLAELGEYDEAAAIQRGVISAARQAGLNDAVERMAANLRLYERRQPCRTPWRSSDPIESVVSISPSR